MSATLSSANFMAQLTRHQFLDLAWKTILSTSGFLGVAGLIRYLGYAPNDVSPTQFDLGEPDAFPVNSETPIPEARAILFHDPQGFRALSLICPHLGCEVQETGAGFSCPCHGSQFDQNGVVTHGPAKNNLAPLEITVDEDDHLILHTQ
jgi:cytochrome b6-f complex iron-sulfur subunit